MTEDTAVKNMIGEQKVCGRLVDREVLACLSSLVDRMSQSEEFMDEIMVAAYSSPDIPVCLEAAVGDLCPEECREVLAEVMENCMEFLAVPEGCEDLRDSLLVYIDLDTDTDDAEQKEEERSTRDRTEDWREFLLMNMRDMSYDELKGLTMLDIDWSENIREPLEHWLVSGWLGSKLEEKDELVYDLYGLTVWGRTCSGQAIKMDGVIKEVARDMEIMPGQKYYEHWLDGGEIYG